MHPKQNKNVNKNNMCIIVVKPEPKFPTVFAGWSKKNETFFNREHDIILGVISNGTVIEMNRIRSKKWPKRDHNYYYILVT